MVRSEWRSAGRSDWRSDGRSEGGWEAEESDGSIVERKGSGASLFDGRWRGLTRGVGIVEESVVGTEERREKTEEKGLELVGSGRKAVVCVRGEGGECMPKLWIVGCA